MVGGGDSIALAIIGLVSAAITALISGIMAIILAKINTKAGTTLANSETTKGAAVATAESVDRIHTAVNSERTAMLEKIDGLTELIRHQAETIAVLVERLKVRDAR